MRALTVMVAVLAAGATAPRAPAASTLLAVPPLEWQASAPGLERTAFEIQVDPNLWHTRVVAVRLDPKKFRFRLRGRLRDLAPDWTVDRAPSTATLAMNIGLYSGIVPWGWTVMAGEEVRPPGQGPLSTAIAWDAAGRVRWLAPNQIDAARKAGDVVEAIQSYPTLLDADGAVPLPLRQRGLGVDVDHRDGRLAIGELHDGRLLIAITRFYALGELAPALPIGLTLDEMAALMRDLGCRRAVSLDGGISAQLLVREGPHTRTWRGWRAVPFGLIAEARSP
jgi:hypothetical protein